MARNLSLKDLELSQWGITLVEAVVALAIIGILMVLSISGLGLLDNRRLAAAARTVVSDLRFVEGRARTERRCWRIAFNPLQERYDIEKLAQGNWTPARGCDATGRGRWQAYRSASFPRPIDLASTTFGADRMTISPFGNPNGGSLTLRTPRGAKRVVTVTPLGRVTIDR
jgi:Tfp pilus assembly protein FimT